MAESLVKRRKRRNPKYSLLRFAAENRLYGVSRNMVSEKKLSDLKIGLKTMMNKLVQERRFYSSDDDLRKLILLAGAAYAEVSPEYMVGTSSSSDEEASSRTSHMIVDSELSEREKRDLALRLRDSVEYILKLDKKESEVLGPKNQEIRVQAEIVYAARHINHLWDD